MDESSERKRRLFLGVALDAESRGACAAALERLRDSGFAAKYEAPEKLHITVAFLGWVAASQYMDVVAAHGSAAEKIAPFGLSLDKVGAFPHERKPRVVYIGAREQGAPFRILVKSVRDAYGALGFDFKNDAVAHVTIARVKPPHRALPLIEFAPIPVRIERLTLFESLPDKARNTSRYEIVNSLELA